MILKPTAELGSLQLVTSNLSSSALDFDISSDFNNSFDILAISRFLKNGVDFLKYGDGQFLLVGVRGKSED